MFDINCIVKTATSHAAFTDLPQLQLWLEFIGADDLLKVHFHTVCTTPCLLLCEEGFIATLRSFNQNPHQIFTLTAEALFLAVHFSPCFSAFVLLRMLVSTDSLCGLQSY